VSPLPPLLVLSHLQATQLLAARDALQRSATVSPDLGLTQAEVTLYPDRVAFGEERNFTWAEVEEIAAAPNTCFAVCAGGLHPIQAFSVVTQRFCSLMATKAAPTLLIAGFPMHRIKDADPCQDTLSKIRAIAPVVGRVLDTATGLGYTAIEASRTAAHVVTIELDPAVLEVARLNPWSQELFGNAKITQLVGDSAELVETLPGGTFSRIIHDPPTFSLAGQLYSGAFYRQLVRLLTQNGRVFHYLGDPSSALGQRVTKGALGRLREAGFARVRPSPQAFGVVAYKS
jgi:predicted methyltransferase